MSLCQTFKIQKANALKFQNFWTGDHDTYLHFAWAKNDGWKNSQQQFPFSILTLGSLRVSLISDFGYESFINDATQKIQFFVSYPFCRHKHSVEWRHCIMYRKNQMSLAWHHLCMTLHYKKRKILHTADILAMGHLI